jgi:RNA polymerase primary sigma factor
LAQEAGLASAQLANLRLSVLSQLSLDAPLGDKQESSLAQLIPDEQARSPYEQLAGASLRELLQEFLGELSTREAYVLRLRFGLEDAEELTLQEVADKLSLTQERVRQIQAAAIKKLRRWITRRQAHLAA